MSQTTRQRLLQRAATPVGGTAELAERLNVTPQTMELWIRGLARMPDRKPLELAAILDELSGVITDFYNRLLDGQRQQSSGGEASI